MGKNDLGRNFLGLTIFKIVLKSLSFQLHFQFQKEKIITESYIIEDELGHILRPYIHSLCHYLSRRAPKTYSHF